MAFDFAKRTRVLADTAWFGEEITYVKSGGATRRIKAAVKRQPPAALTEAPDVIAPQTTVIVVDDATSGISLAELETSTDTLQFPERIGGTARTWSIAGIVHQTNGKLTLEVA